MKYMKCTFKAFLLLSLYLPLIAYSASGEKIPQVQKVALDYIHSWYVGDAVLMESTIHPQLVKRSIQVDPVGSTAIVVTENASELLSKTAAGGAGKRIREDQRTSEILEYSIGEGIAHVRIRAARWDESLQMAYLNGEWKILNIVWEMHPQGKADD